MAQHINIEDLIETLSLRERKIINTSPINERDFNDTRKQLSFLLETREIIIKLINKSKFCLGTSMVFQKLWKEYSLYNQIWEEIFQYIRKKQVFEVHINKEEKRILWIFIIS